MRTVTASFAAVAILVFVTATAPVTTPMHFVGKNTVDSVPLQEAKEE
jgi:CBS-domain-containing membrane protein